jgi:arginyl-tRNA--protein-N-Asp/Glu arginylyltransferase
MRERSPPDDHSIALYLTPEHDCSYLSGQLARTLFIDPATPTNPVLYQYLLSAGFRRSGDHVYRPHCNACQACVPVRVPVAGFTPRRSQRRCWRALADRVEVNFEPSGFQQEHYQLYLRYTASRHREGGMAEADEERYLDFLLTRWCPSEFLTFRLDGRLLAVAVTDVLPDALSAVYTFFDPELSHLGLGTFAILRQIDEARRRGLRHLYLGYWIGECQKMSYKEKFRPIEAWDGRQWRSYDAGVPLVG